MPLIKRYANRKLYNAQTRAYVTLEEISRMIQDGEDVTVIDHETGADITAVTLTQVIFDQEKRLGGLFPKAVFSRLIEARDNPLSAVQQGLESFLDPDRYVNREIQRRLDILHQENALSLETYQNLTELLLDKRYEQMNDDINDEVSIESVEALMKQVETLEAELSKLKRKKID